MDVIMSVLGGFLWHFQTDDRIGTVDNKSDF